MGKEIHVPSKERLIPRENRIKAIQDLYWIASEGYKAPEGGIPATDLSEDVQSSLNKAGTALQTIKTVNGQSLVGSGDIEILEAGTTETLVIDETPTAGSENLVTSGGVQNEFALGAVYDVSAKNPTAGSNNDGKWESLSALLSDVNLNTLIPTSIRKGGMSVKYVQTSDNKYVQFRYMGTATTGSPNPFLDTANWQGVDDEPTSGSDNLAKSGRIFDNIYLSGTPYLLEESTFNGDMDAKTFKNFLIDFKLKITRDNSKNYGVYWINNGLPAGTSYSYYFRVYSYPASETPTSSNITSVGVFQSATKPENGVIETPEFIALLNWDALTEAFGATHEFSGTGNGLRFNQEYLFDGTTGYLAENKRISDIESEIEGINGEITALDEKIDDSIENLFKNGVVNSLPGEVAYYEQYDSGYGNAGVAQYSQVAQAAYSFNIIKLGPVKCSSSTTRSCNYSIRKGVSTNIVSPSLLTEIKTGTLSLDTTYKQFDIEFDSVIDVAAGEVVVIYFWYDAGFRDVTILGKKGTDTFDKYTGSNGALYIGNGSIASPMTTSWNKVASYAACSPILSITSEIDRAIESALEEKQPEITNNVISSEAFDSAVDTIVGEAIKDSNSVEICLPDKLYAVVGDTLQVFFSGIIKARDYKNYDIRVSCLKGHQYQRYFEYAPVSGDVGTTDFNIEVRNNRGDLIDTKTCELKTVAAPTSPQTQKNILCFGDSLTESVTDVVNHGAWCEEACRRLTGSSGTGSPAAKGLSNISFCGSLHNDLAYYFGAGGWTWNSYLTKGSPAFRFEVTGVTSVNYGAVYTNNGHSYTVREVNVTNGSGTILCSVSSASDTPSSSGTLTKSSGSGQDEITFTNSYTDSQNPLWDNTNNKMSFVPYADTYCNGQIDVVYILLTWNGLELYMTDFSSMVGQIKTFADVLHSEFPSAKLKIMSVPLPSPYDASSPVAKGKFDSYSYSDAYALKITALNMAKAYQALANSTEESGTSGDAYNTFIEYVAIPSQYDCEYSSQITKKPANTRINVVNYAANTAYPTGTYLRYQDKVYIVTTAIPADQPSFYYSRVQEFNPYETVTANSVHPAIAGYMQIADAVYRNIVANYCQST